MISHQVPWYESKLHAPRRLRLRETNPPLIFFSFELQMKSLIFNERISRNPLHIKRRQNFPKSHRGGRVSIYKINIYIYNYLSVPLQLLVELRWLVEGGFVPVAEPGVSLQAPKSGASPLLAKATLWGNFRRPLKSFLLAFLDKSNSLAAELTFAALLTYAVDMLSRDDEKYLCSL